MSTPLVVVCVIVLVLLGVVVGLGVAAVEDAHRTRERMADPDPWFEDVVQAVEEYLQAYAAWRDAPKSDREWRSVDMEQAKDRVVEMWEAAR